jgi:hypothetical protein
MPNTDGLAAAVLSRHRHTDSTHSISPGIHGLAAVALLRTGP